MCYDFSSLNQDLVQFLQHSKHLILFVEEMNK